MAPTITEIRAAVKRLAVARTESTTRATALQEALADTVRPIYEAHRPGIDTAAEEEAAAKADLQRRVDASPQLFARPRSISEDGVKTGYRKAEDTFEWDDMEQVIARIRALPETAEMAAVLIRTEETLNIAALAELPGNLRRRIGVRLVEGVDQSFISFGESDVDKLVKGLIADAAKRQGEDEPAKKSKAKAKAKTSEVA